MTSFLRSSWHFGRGQRHLFAGRFDRAEAELRKAVELAPDRPAPHLYRGIALAWLDRKDEAADEAMRAAMVSKRAAPTAFFAALLAADAGRLPEAREQVERGAKDDPNNPYGPSIRAFIALREGDRGKAVKALLSRDLAPSDEYMLRVLLTLEEPRKPSFASAGAAGSRPASATKPSHTVVSESARLVNEGVTLVEKEEYPAAVETLKKAVALTPDDPTARACLGEALFLAGDRASAEREFLLRNELASHEELKRDEQSMLVEGYLGRIDYLEGRADRAFERLSRAVAAGSPSPDDRYFLGLCHRFRGEPREAYLAWGRIRRDDPDFLRRRLRELLGLKRGRPAGAFDWIGELFSSQKEKAS